MEQTVKFAYWNIRGVAHVCRMLLVYTKTAFQDLQYSITMDQGKWFGEDKHGLGLDFPNLPYLIDGEFKLTETAAIQNYIIRMSGRIELLGVNMIESAQVTRLLAVINEACKNIRDLAWKEGYQEKLKQCFEKGEAKLVELQQYLADRPFFLGRVTLADFVVSQHSYYIEKLYPEEYKRFSFLGRIRRNVNNLAEIKQYYSRPDSFQGPFLPEALASFTIDLKPEPEQEMHSDIRLGYWNFRGLGQVARLLLAYSRVQFEDIRYKYIDHPQEWFNRDKTSLGLPFPNLPYLITPQIKLTESIAIYKYIIDCYCPDLLPRSPKEAAVAQQVLGVWKDVFQGIIELFWSQDREQGKASTLDKCRDKFNYLQKFIREKDFFLGYPTLTDFIIAEESQCVQMLYPEECNEWPFLKSVLQNVNRLPAIADYYGQENSFKGPFIPESERKVQFNNELKPEQRTEQEEKAEFEEKAELIEKVEFGVRNELEEKMESDEKTEFEEKCGLEVKVRSEEKCCLEVKVGSEEKCCLEVKVGSEEKCDLEVKVGSEEKGEGVESTEENK